jgi:predicted ester cyclase
VAQTHEQGRSRATMLRRMIEEDGGIDPKLYASDCRSYRPWDLVAQTLSRASDQTERLREKDLEPLTVRRMYSDVKLTVEDTEENGDEVRIRWRMLAVNSNEFFGIEPTGEAVEATGYSTYRFSGNRIVEIRAAVDCSSLGAICSRTVEALARARTLQGVCLVNPTESIQPAR